MAEYKLSYTANEINEKLGKVDEIDSLKNLVGNTSVKSQINQAIAQVDEIVQDMSLTMNNELDEIRSTTLELEAKLYDGSIVKFNILGQEVST